MTFGDIFSAGPACVWRRLWLMSVVLLVGCSGAQKAAEEPGSASEREKSRDKSAQTALQLGPVDTPPGVVVRFRARSLPQVLDGIFDAASIPINWRDVLEEDEDLAPLLSILDADGTIEGAVMLNPRAGSRSSDSGRFGPARAHQVMLDRGGTGVSGFMSFGVAGFDRVLRALDKGRIDVQEGPGGVYYFDYEGEPCALGHAISGSPARVVCSDTREELDLLLPYALRGLPREVLSDAHFHIEFDMEPLRARHGAELKTYLRWVPAFARTLHQGNPTFDRAISDGAILVSDEAGALIDDLDSISAQGFVEGSNFRALLQARFVGGASETVKALVDLSKKQGKVPALFDQIPSTASAAGYSNELSEERTKPWWSVLADLAQGGAELEGCSPTFAKKVSKVVLGFASRGNVHVVARGPLVTSLFQGKQRMHSAWALTGTTRAKNEVVTVMDDLVWVLRSPDLKKLLGESEAPDVQKVPTKIPGVPTAQVYRWKLSGTARGVAQLLGAELPESFDAEDLTDVLDAEEGHLGIFEAAGGTWISWGRDVRELSEAYRALTSKDAERLADRGSLDGVRSEPATSAGYVMLSGIVGSFGWSFPGTLTNWDDIRKAIPNRGEAPATYFFRVTPSAAAGQPIAATWEIRVPKEFVQDSVVLGYLVDQEMKKSEQSADD